MRLLKSLQKDLVGLARVYIGGRAHVLFAGSVEKSKITLTIKRKSNSISLDRHHRPLLGF